MNLFERDFLIAVGVDAPGSGRCEVEESLDGAAGAAASPLFQNLAQQHENDDNGGGFKIDANLAVNLHGDWEHVGHHHRDGAEGERGPDANGDQREHVQLPRQERTPTATEKRPTRPPHHGSGESELQPTRCLAIDPRIVRHGRNQMRHGENEYGQGQRGADPEPPRHVAQLGVVIFVVRRGRNRFSLQRHAALRAVAGMILLHLWMHRARIDDCRGGLPRGVTFESHAALWAVARLVRLHVGTHGAKEFRVRRWCHPATATARMRGRCGLCVMG